MELQHRAQRSELPAARRRCCTTDSSCAASPTLFSPLPTLWAGSSYALGDARLSLVGMSMSYGMNSCVGLNATCTTERRWRSAEARREHACSKAVEILYRVEVGRGVQRYCMRHIVYVSVLGAIVPTCPI